MIHLQFEAVKKKQLVLLESKAKQEPSPFLNWSKIDIYLNWTEL